MLRSADEDTHRSLTAVVWSLRCMRSLQFLELLHTIRTSTHSTKSARTPCPYRFSLHALVVTAKRDWGRNRMNSSGCAMLSSPDEDTHRSLTAVVWSLRCMRSLQFLEVLHTVTNSTHSTKLARKPCPYKFSLHALVVTAKRR